MKEALLSLLQNHDLSDISIGEICDQAQLTRPTFYNHFKSKEDIASEIIDDALDDFDHDAMIEEIESVEAIINAFLAFWERNKTLLNILSINHLLSLVANRFIPHLEEIHVNATFTDKSLSREELAFHNAFLAAGMAGMLEEWSRAQDEIRAADISGYMNNMLESLFKGMER